MKIPKYWASGTAKVRADYGEVDLTFWRWSDTSLAEAVQAAESRAREVASRFTSFQNLDRYGYADRPLREEVIDVMKGSDGRDSAIVTRNAYGALILNTARVMFIDIDFDTKPVAQSSGLAGLFRSKSNKAPAPSPVDQQIARLEEWGRRNPQFSLRVYRTHGGLRGLITNELFEPTDPSSTQILQSLNSDPLYVRLCRAQECFRARLTPKPWRCGSDTPPSRYPWPTATAEMLQRQWERAYEHAAARFTTCKLVKEISSTSMPSDVARIVEIHDRYACRGDNLDLA